MAVGAFPVHQERQALFESQFGVLWIVELFLQTLSKGGQAELNEFVEQRLDEHGDPSHL
jgi:hypothetical protein